MSSGRPRPSAWATSPRVSAVAAQLQESSRERMEGSGESPEAPPELVESHMSACHDDLDGASLPLAGEEASAVRG